jgi:hypothetical protein
MVDNAETGRTLKRRTGIVYENTRSELSYLSRRRFRMQKSGMCTIGRIPIEGNNLSQDEGKEFYKEE